VTPPAPTLGRDGTRPVLLWRFDAPRIAVSSAPVGGGIGWRAWVCNAQVDDDYARTDLAEHIAEIAAANGCGGDGVGMLTAASVERACCARDGDVTVYATVGLSHPTWAADADGGVSPWRPGTINVVAFVPVTLSEGALVNAVVTATEAKTQALVEAGVPGTGTASDAVCVVCEASAATERFAGPRSSVGARLARAVHGAVRRGIG
jgi:adenosylcobinamide amidohydrolase